MRRPFYNSSSMRPAIDLYRPLHTLSKMVRAPLGAVAAVGPADMQPNAIDLVQGTETGPGSCHREPQPEGSLDATLLALDVLDSNVANGSMAGLREQRPTGSTIRDTGLPERRHSSAPPYAAQQPARPPRRGRQEQFSDRGHQSWPQPDVLQRKLHGTVAPLPGRCPGSRGLDTVVRGRNRALARPVVGPQVLARHRTLVAPALPSLFPGMREDAD